MKLCKWGINIFSYVFLNFTTLNNANDPKIKQNIQIVANYLTDTIELIVCTTTRAGMANLRGVGIIDN